LGWSILESPFLFDCTAVHMSCKCNSSLTDETLHSYTTLGIGCAERRIIPVRNISREIMISAGRSSREIMGSAGRVVVRIRATSK